VLTLHAHYRIVIRDAGGRVVRRTRWRRSKSYVQQIAEMLLCVFEAANLGGVKDTGGTDRTLDNNGAGHNFRVDGGAGDETMGSVVGTGSTAVDITDSDLATRIAHGTGAGQLEYQAVSFSAFQVAGQVAQFTFARVFTNSSGASLTINEVGVYMRFRDSGVNLRVFLVIRDVVAGGEAVGNGQTATLEYVISVTA